MTSPHRRILASAGTGKTWQLTTQWLALLLRDPAQRPEAILATTFTRAAAGEIRERILRRLATAALTGEEGDAERRAIGGLEGMGLPPIPAESCAATLRRVIDRLDRLQIRTLDSFFFALASGSAFELALPMPLEPLDEHGTRTLARAAIDETVEDLGDRDGEALFAVLDALTEGHPGRSVADLVDRSCRDLLALVGEAPASAWEWADEVVGDEPRAVDVAAVADALDGHADLVERDRSLGDGHLRNALRADAKRLRTLASIEREHEVPLETWVEVLDKGTTGAVASKGGAYRGKPLAQDLVDVLVPVVARARWRLAKIAVHRTRAAAGLARALDDRRRTIMARGGRVTFDSVTAAVAEHLASHPLGDLLRRVDARIEHLLLDEFQDTSRIQWRALRPLASEIAACGDGSRRFFAVGDLKQSIYGWRGGDPEILEHLEDRFEAGPGGVEFAEMRLDLSRRSTQAVLDAVNAVFGSIATNEVAGRCSEAARAWWGRIFTTHQAHRTEPGVAQLHLVERDAAAEETDSHGGDGENGDVASGRGISAKARAVV
ncbi:MAG: UvrD-helicase domain-containing protein, partial [Planctomycetota bacterium]